MSEKIDAQTWIGQRLPARAEPENPVPPRRSLADYATARALRCLSEQAEETAAKVAALEAKVADLEAWRAEQERGDAF